MMSSGGRAGKNNRSIHRVLTFRIRENMTRSSKIIGLLLVVCIVLVYINISTRRQSDDPRLALAPGFNSSFVSWMNDLLPLPPLPSDLLEKNAKAVAAEEALINKVKASMLPPAVGSNTLKLSKASRTYFSQAHQDELVEKMTRKKVNGTFFEAGALDGELFSNTLHLERALGWTGLLVEPGQKSFDKLKQKGRRARLLHACLSPNLAAAEMIFDAMGDNPALAKLASSQSKKTSGTETVSCYPLYTILQAIDVPVIDYLSLDIEGDELKVLNTVPWGRVKVRVLGIEISHVPEGSEAVRVFMEHKGFVFYKQQGEDYFFYHPDYASELDVS